MCGSATNKHRETSGDMHHEETDYVGENTYTRIPPDAPALYVAPVSIYPGTPEMYMYSSRVPSSDASSRWWHRPL